MKKVFLFITAVILFSCSSDDSSSPNGFTFDSENYNLKYAWITDPFGNPDPIVSTQYKLDFTNVYINEDSNEVRNTVSMLLDIDTDTLEPGTYDIIYDYKIATDVIYEQGVLASRTMILDSSQSNPQLNGSGTATVHSVSGNKISVSFKMTRADGKVLNGSYKGAYTTPNSI